MGALRVSHRQSASAAHDYRRCAGVSGSSGRGAIARATSNAVRSSVAGVPAGAFAYSDGLEAAAVLWMTGHRRQDAERSVEHLRAWMDVTLDETIGRLDGPAVWRAWHAFREERWDVIVALDEELTALRPLVAARRSSRAIGLRVLTTWSTL